MGHSCRFSDIPIDMDPNKIDEARAAMERGSTEQEKEDAFWNTLYSEDGLTEREYWTERADEAQANRSAADPSSPEWVKADLALVVAQAQLGGK